MSALATVWLVLSVVVCVAMAIDCRARPQHMAVMAVTWPLTALYFGPVAWFPYAWLGRAMPASHHHDHHHHNHHHDADQPHGLAMWRATFVGTTHCGGGCALGDLVGEGLAGVFHPTLGSSALLASLLIDLLVAYGFGLAFQYASIRPMNPGMSRHAAVMAAIKADTASILAFEVGMFAVMILRADVAPALGPGDALFWLWMQGAMIAGFATAFPANWALVRAGLKEAM